MSGKSQDKLREKQKAEEQAIIGSIRTGLLNLFADFANKHANKFFILISVLAMILIIDGSLLFLKYLHQSDQEKQMGILWQCISYVIVFFFGNIVHSKK